MKKLSSLVVAAAVAAGGFTFATNARADDNDTTVGQKVDNAVDRTQEAAKDAKANWDQGRINTMLAQVTNASLTKGGFDDLIERFNDADRNRLGAYFEDRNNKEKMEVLDGRIAQFQKDWKAKYNQDFKIAKDDVVFARPAFTAVRGEIGTDARLAGKKVPAGEKVTADDLNQPKNAAGNTKLDANIEKGRNIAYVTVAESHGLPELKVPLIHELPDMWKIDVPDNVTGQKLYDNLLTHLTMANEQKDQWPSDVTEGYRTVAHHVLMAVLDVNEKAEKAGAKIGGDSAKPADSDKPAEK